MLLALARGVEALWPSMGFESSKMLWARFHTLFSNSANVFRSHFKIRRFQFCGHWGEGGFRLVAACGCLRGFASIAQREIAATHSGMCKTGSHIAPLIL